MTSIPQGSHRSCIRIKNRTLAAGPRHFNRERSDRFGALPEPIPTAGPNNLPQAFRNSRISDDDIAFVGERRDQVRVVALALDEIGTRITLRSYTKFPTTAPAPPSPTQ